MTTGLYTLALATWLGASGSEPATGGNAADLRAAIEAYEDLRYEDALALLTPMAEEDLPVTEQARLQLYLGLIRFTIGERGPARQHFARALAGDPQIALPAHVSPKISTLFDEVRRSQQPAPPEATPQAPEPDSESPEPAIAATPVDDEKTQSSHSGTVLPLESPPRSTPLEDRLPWITTSVGGGFLLAGAIASIVSHRARNDYESERWADAAQRHADRSATASTWATGFYIVGAALASGGVLWLALEPIAPEVALSLTPTSVGVRAAF